MSTRPNDPVFSDKQKAQTDPSDPTGPCLWVSTGLTKREWFAGKVMEGLLSNSAYKRDWLIQMPKDAIAYADALIAELNKEPKS